MANIDEDTVDAIEDTIRNLAIKPGYVREGVELKIYLKRAVYVKNWVMTILALT